MTSPGTCLAIHRTQPDRPRPALGGLLLCFGHYTALTETLTGPSAADDPTLDAAWGIRIGRYVTVCPDRTTAQLALREAVGMYEGYAHIIPTASLPVLVCGEDGTAWHDPRDYKPGQLARDYTTLTGLTGHVTATAAHVTGSADPRLPINPRVAEVRDQIAGALRSWARVHVEEMRTTPPADASPATVTAWLSRYIDWSAAQPWVDAYLGELTDLRSQARGLIDLPRPRRIDVGVCVERPGGVRCEGRLSTRPREDGDPTPLTIECDTCEASYSGDQWERLGKRIKSDTRRMVA